MSSRKSLVFSSLIVICFNLGCTGSDSDSTNRASSFYPIQRVQIKNIKLTDNFWLSIVKKVQEKTIQYALDKSNEEGRFYNFLIAGGKLVKEISWNTKTKHISLAAQSFSILKFKKS